MVLFWGPTNKQYTWLLQGTFTYKLTKLQELEGIRCKQNLQTYKSYKTYKPISIALRSSQPGGPEGAGGFLCLG